VAGAISTDGLLDLAQKLGLADLLVNEVKRKIQEQDLDEEVVEEARAYLSRNPEVLVISLGALTIAGYERRLQQAS
jgi:hypothetical protein